MEIDFEEFGRAKISFNTVFAANFNLNLAYKTKGWPGDRMGSNGK